MIEISKERKEAYVEVVEILKHMNRKYVDKLPKKLIEFFKDNSSPEYKFILDVPLQEKKLKKETVNLLAMLNLNYWCEDEDHKKNLLTKYHQNEIKLKEELLEKYNYDNLFKAKKVPMQINQNSEEECISLIQYKESFFRRIINIIKRAIYRKR